MAGGKTNVFVLGLDEYNLRQLRTIRNADRYAFHPLLGRQEITRSLSFPMEELVGKAEERLDSFPGRVDGIVGYFDFPTSVLLPILRAHCGLPGPTLESILRCEHKYWSRTIQKRVLPDMVPQFRAVDPFDAASVAGLDLPYPYWLKPVKSHSSYLGFRIGSRRELDHAIERIRRGIHRFGDPLDYAMQRADLPPGIATVDGHHCIAEAMISAGRQCTLEGYVRDGEVVIYGTVDSIRDRTHRSTFARYEYPSRLPRGVRRRMAGAADAVMREIGLDDAPFNVEFYYDGANDRLSLLEINARISKSHCPLFTLVDGASHHQIMVQLATGERPELPRRRGRFRAAAKFMLRRYRDAIVSRAPTPDELAELEARMPGTDIHIGVSEGDRLSELPYQDSYSYEVAEIFMGGASHAALLRRYRELLDRLPLRFAEPGPEDGARGEELSA